MDFPIQAILSGTFDEELTNEELLAQVNDDEDELNHSLDVEAHERFLPDIQEIIPEASVTIINKNMSTLETEIPNTYKYTMHYVFSITTDIEITQELYISLRDTIFNEIDEVTRWANNDRVRSYTDNGVNYDDVPNGYIELKIIDPLKEATKNNIKVRTTEAGLMGLPLPTNVIKYVINPYIGKKLPENALRSRPLAAPLTNERLASIPVAERLPPPVPQLNTLTSAATPAPNVAVAAGPPPKVPWYKRMFGMKGGKRKTLRRKKSRKGSRKNKRRATHKRRY